MGQGHPECAQRLDAIEDRLLITALGRPDDRFDRFILAQCRTARSQAGELPPVAELEREWVMGGWTQAMDE